ncbi:sigma-54-dependent Fis family transcriptional regulator [bacterium]|nr:sigma-54-dependent Fis family transcriptional regulator [bacterium]
MIIGQSPQAMKVKKMIREIAKTDDNALIIGEEGSGKQFIAKEIHNRSRHKNRPFIVLNCTAVGETITEADLFGEKIEGPMGVERKVGLLEQAKKGLLYLENVHELKTEYQLKFINVLKERKFQKLGEKAFIEANFRVIASTTEENISKMDTFRKDLLSMLNTFTMIIPSLKKRKQDIPIFFIHFLQEYCAEFGHEVPPVPAELFESLMEYEWPGNIHELQNAVRNLVLMSPEGTLSIEYLPFEVKRHPFEILDDHELPDAVGEIEKYLIKKSLRRFAGNQSKAARVLNISEAALRYKMKKYGLTRKAF